MLMPSLALAAGEFVYSRREYTETTSWDYTNVWFGPPKANNGIFGLSSVVTQFVKLHFPFFLLFGLLAEELLCDFKVLF